MSPQRFNELVKSNDPAQIGAAASWDEDLEYENIPWLSRFGDVSEKRFSNRMRQLRRCMSACLELPPTMVNEFSAVHAFKVTLGNFFAIINEKLQHFLSERSNCSPSFVSTLGLVQQAPSKSLVEAREIINAVDELFSVVVKAENWGLFKSPHSADLAVSEFEPSEVKRCLSTGIAAVIDVIRKFGGSTEAEQTTKKFFP